MKQTSEIKALIAQLKEEAAKCGYSASVTFKRNYNFLAICDLPSFEGFAENYTGYRFWHKDLSDPEFRKRALVVCPNKLPWKSVIVLINQVSQHIWAVKPAWGLTTDTLISGIVENPTLNHTYGEYTKGCVSHIAILPEVDSSSVRIFETGRRNKDEV